MMSNPEEAKNDNVVAVLANIQSEIKTIADIVVMQVKTVDSLITLVNQQQHDITRINELLGTHDDMQR